MDDRIDWADVAAVGALATEYMPWEDEDTDRGPVRTLLEKDSRGWRRLIGVVSAALREAYEAGLRERIDVLDCDACGERHMTERGAAIVAENRALRREVAARRAVDGWLRADSCRSLRVTYWGDVCATIWEDGNERIVAMKANYLDLAAALGLEVEDE